MAIAGIDTIKRSTRVNLDCRFRSWYHCLSLCKLFHTPQKYIGVLKYIKCFMWCRKLTHFLSIFRRRKTCILLKTFTEIIPVTVSHPRGNICNFIPGVRQQLLGLFHSVFCEVLISSLTGLIFEEGTHIRG